MQSHAASDFDEWPEMFPLYFQMRSSPNAKIGLCSDGNSGQAADIQCILGNVLRLE